MSVLDDLAMYARARVNEDKQKICLDEVKRLVKGKRPGAGEEFYKAIGGNGISFICEVKKASPSKGIIDEKFDYLAIAREYEKAGADRRNTYLYVSWIP